MTGVRGSGQSGQYGMRRLMLRLWEPFIISLQICFFGYNYRPFQFFSCRKEEATRGNLRSIVWMELQLVYSISKGLVWDERQPYNVFLKAFFLKWEVAVNRLSQAIVCVLHWLSLLRWSNSDMCSTSATGASSTACTGRLRLILRKSRSKHGGLRLCFADVEGGWCDTDWFSVVYFAWAPRAQASAAGDVDDATWSLAKSSLFGVVAPCAVASAWAGTTGVTECLAAVSSAGASCAIRLGRWRYRLLIQRFGTSFIATKRSIIPLSQRLFTMVDEGQIVTNRPNP